MDRSMNTKNEYKVKFVKFSDGERYPLLVNSIGIPHWYVTLFTTTQVRNASKAPNTIAAVLSSIKVLLDWTDTSNINLELRFAQRNFFTEQELESLRNHTQTKSTKRKKTTPIKVVPLFKNTERSRSIIQKNTNKVTSSTQISW